MASNTNHDWATAALHATWARCVRALIADLEAQLRVMQGRAR